MHASAPCIVDLTAPAHVICKSRCPTHCMSAPGKALYTGPGLKSLASSGLPLSAVMKHAGATLHRHLHTVHYTQSPGATVQGIAASSHEWPLHARPEL